MGIAALRMRYGHKVGKSINLLAIRKRRLVPQTTDSNHDFEVAINVARRLTPTAINQLWVADITYVRLGRVDVFLAVVMDVFSRKIVGWNLGPTLATELALVALRAAIEARQPAPGRIHHSDRGVQYASATYVDTLLQHGIVPSMSRPANPYDNAKCERFMKTLKQEEIRCFEYRDMKISELICTSFLTVTTTRRGCIRLLGITHRTSSKDKRQYRRKQKRPPHPG